LLLLHGSSVNTFLFGSSQRLVCILLFTVQAAACTSQWSNRGTAKNLENIAPEGWVVRSAESTALPVMLSYPSKQAASAPTLVIYIEGDGHAWHRKNIPSQDPTPRYPMGLWLAESGHTNADVAYVARPCQFRLGSSQKCEQSTWTSHRYAAESVDSIGSAIDELWQDADQDIVLVGYSGGGVIAALLAANRSNIAAFITVAANLDTSFWTSLHNVTPLANSQNPSALGDRLRNIPQVHFVGGRDEIVPPSVLESYLQSVDLSSSNHAIMLQDYDHRCCWVSNWPELFDAAMDKLNLPRNR